MSKRILVALALIAGTLAANPVPVARGQMTPPFRIAFPPDGAVINNGTGITTFFRPTENDAPRPRDRVFFTYDYFGDAAGPVKIKGPPLMDIGNGSILLDTSRLPGGEYGLRARLIEPDGDAFNSPIRRVMVNQEPFALATGEFVSIDPLRMRFNAHARDGDGQIGSIRWDFGDGTTADGGVVEHDFPGPGTYIVKVRVLDDMGGEFVSSHIVKIERDGNGFRYEMHKNEECGCESIRVKTSGDIEPTGFGFNGMTSFPVEERTRLGPFNPGEGDQLPNDHGRITCRFEVIAELIPGSDPSKCAEGVRYQQTFFIDDPNDPEVNGAHPVVASLSSDPRYDSSKSNDDPFTERDVEDTREQGRCGVGGSRWCDGGYHGGGTATGVGERGIGAPDPWKLHGGESIYMLFLPGKDFAPRRDGGIQSTSFRYHVRIGPDAAPCECFIDVNIRYNAETGRVLHNQVDEMNCSP